MRSYLSLISISAKVRRRQNRMTILCIVFAVFLVTAMFSIADMMIRMENSSLSEKHGNWHLKLDHITSEDAEEILRRTDVKAVGASAVFNMDGEEPWHINEKKAVLYGTDEIYIREITNGITEGRFPEEDNEVMLTPNAAAAFQVQIGDNVTLHTPTEDMVFQVSGFGTDDKAYYADQTYLVGAYLTHTAFASLMEENGRTDNLPGFYVQFKDAAKAARAKAELQSQYGLTEEDISENKGVMAMAGQSGSSSAHSFYGMMSVLFVLVLLTGIFMISGSMNSNVAQRTQLFGMMRCIGASRSQIIRFVRLEALNWCKTAVPAGIVLGTVISWCLCGSLRYGIGGEFATMPMFQISPVGLVCGAAVGITTVLFAAQSPAKRAAKVSPVYAVSGNAENPSTARHAFKAGHAKIDCLLGIHHALGKKKNWCLVTASFALTIILFFSFSVVMDFARLLLPAMNVTTADMILNGYANARILDKEMVQEIRKIDGVKTAYGSVYMDKIPALSSREGVDSVNIVSYDDVLLAYAKKGVAEGSLEAVYGENGGVATVFNKENPLRMGDTIQIGNTEVTVSCVLSQGLFGDDLIVICSEETFTRLLGEQKYNLVCVQFGEAATEETAALIRGFENEDIIVTDKRRRNQEDVASYWASRIACYGFLGIIGLITMFNIINCISMSVSARSKQYGTMRAVGMEGGQLTRMIFAETFTYAVSGLIVGCGLGIPLSRILYVSLITRHFGVTWRLPVYLLIVAVIFVGVCAGVAGYAPAKRIRGMEVTEVIGEL